MGRIIRYAADTGAFDRSKAAFARPRASLTDLQRLDYGANMPSCPASLVNIGEAREEIVPAELAPGEVALDVTDEHRAAGGVVGVVWRTQQAKRAMTSEELAAELGGLKAAKWGAIEAKMQEIIAAGFSYEVPGSGVAHVYQIGTAAQVNMTSVAADFGLGEADAHGGFWRTAANVNVTMGDAECIAFLKAAKNFKQGVIRRYWELLAAAEAVEAWADRAELDLIDPAAGSVGGVGGWPG